MAVSTFQTTIESIISSTLNNIKTSSVIIEIANRFYINKFKRKLYSKLETYAAENIKKEDKESFIEFLKDYKYESEDSFELKAVQEVLSEFYIRFSTDNKIIEKVTKVSEI